MIKKIIDFVTHGIWQKKDSDYQSNRARWAARQFKILIFMIRGFGEHDVNVRSAALTFYTVMSVVPIAALVFGIMKGFGMDANLSNYLYSNFPQYGPVIEQVLDFANNLLMRTKGGVIASVGFVVLLWSVMRVFGNVESAFNHIWEVRHERSFARKFSDYITVIFVAPIMWLISYGVLRQLRTQFLGDSNSVFMDILFGMISLVAIWIMFAFIYRVMPNTKVKIRNAIMAGIIAGTAFQLFQVGYFYVQAKMTSYNAIYGSFAALPLFLIWVQTSWQILLSGAELSFAYQNIAHYEQEREALTMNYDMKRKVMVAVMATVIKHFVRNTGAVSSDAVAEELDIPVRVVRDVIFELERSGLLLAVQNDQDEKIPMYVPARDVHGITLWEVVNCAERSGTTSIDLEHCSQLTRVGGLMDKIREESLSSPNNILLITLINEERSYCG